MKFIKFTFFKGDELTLDENEAKRIMGHSGQIVRVMNNGEWTGETINKADIANTRRDLEREKEFEREEKYKQEHPSKEEASTRIGDGNDNRSSRQKFIDSNGKHPNGEKKAYSDEVLLPGKSGEIRYYKRSNGYIFCKEDEFAGILRH